MTTIAKPIFYLAASMSEGMVSMKLTVPFLTMAMKMDCLDSELKGDEGHEKARGDFATPHQRPSRPQFDIN